MDQTISLYGTHWGDAQCSFNCPSLKNKSLMHCKIPRQTWVPDTSNNPEAFPAKFGPPLWRCVLVLVLVQVHQPELPSYRHPLRSQACVCCVACGQVGMLTTLAACGRTQRLMGKARGNRWSAEEGVGGNCWGNSQARAQPNRWISIANKKEVCPFQSGFKFYVSRTQTYTAPIQCSYMHFPLLWP